MKIVSVERHTTVHGGGELVAAWILEALKDEHELTVFGWSKPDWELRNQFYGTSLSADQVAFAHPPRLLKAAFKLIGADHIDQIGFQMFAALMRSARRISAEQDLAISPLDEFDFGVRGLQYIHFPWLQTALRQTPVLGEPRERRPWARLADFSVARVRANGMVTNSRYSARAIREHLGIDAEVIYPPCPGDFPPRPWERRSDSVVMIGRLVAHKRFDLAVEVVRRVRAEAGDVRLVVIGNWRGVGHSDRVEVGRLLSSEPWIELREEVSRADLGAVVSESRYGIHPFEGEPYGIAVAEMVRAGCIPITRRSGGPPEITGEDERLRFDSAEEGAARLLALMRSEDDRHQIRAQLRRRAPALAPEEFVRRIRDWVSSAAGAAG